MLTTLLAGIVTFTPNIAIAPGTIEKHVRFMASEELQGRMTLRPGMDKAAKYIADEFKKYGLEAREKDGSFVHTYDLSLGFKPSASNMLVFSIPGGKEMHLKLEEDFVPLVGSKMRLVRGPMVWLGYGNEADYEGIDVKDKVVLAFRGAQTGRGATNNMKARWAKEKGAVGIIFVGGTGQGAGELPAMTRSQGVNDSLEFPAAAVKAKFFSDLTGLDFEKARASTEKQSKPVNALVRMVAETEANTGKAVNVIGYLPGTDPTLRNEYIVIGGHFDHLGMGEVGSRTGSDMIHYGADDNASGTAGVLAAAEYWTKNRTNRRTIIFQCYSGEEFGLRGSNGWCADNAEILKNTSAMMNMDMIGTVRFDQTFVYGLTSSEDWLPLFSNVKVDNLRLLLCPNTRGDSDQASFISRNVPALFFHTGLTNEYHTEKDTIDRVNFPGAAKVVEAVIQTAMQVDAKAGKLTWNPKVERGNRPSDRNQPTGPMESPMKPPVK